MCVQRRTERRRSAAEGGIWSFEGRARTVSAPEEEDKRESVLAGLRKGGRSQLVRGAVVVPVRSDQIAERDRCEVYVPAWCPGKRGPACPMRVDDAAFPEQTFSITAGSKCNMLSE